MSTATSLTPTAGILAKQVNDQFFAALNPEETQKAAASSAVDPATAKAMQLLKDSPELASAILKIWLSYFRSPENESCPNKTGLIYYETKELLKGV